MAESSFINLVECKSSIKYTVITPVNPAPITRKGELKS